MIAIYCHTHRASGKKYVGHNLRGRLRVTVQALMLEALEDVVAKHGRR